MVDQFRYDYLTRFRHEYTGGLDRLLTKGAVIVNANLEHYPTVTAVGHATFMSGATPAVSGIMGNDWYDRASGKNVTSVSDDSVKLLGGQGREPASPHRLLVSTLGDEMKMSGKGTPRVIGISLKDRSAILPVGRRADAAYWYDPAAGSFVTSTYYLTGLPAWVKEFNDQHVTHKYAGAEWAFDDRGQAKSVLLAKDAGPGLFAGVYNSPFGNELLESFVEAALRAEKLGQRNTTDLLSISFSSNDAVGHACRQAQYRSRILRAKYRKDALSQVSRAGSVHRLRRHRSWLQVTHRLPAQAIWHVLDRRRRQPNHRPSLLPPQRQV